MLILPDSNHQIINGLIHDDTPSTQNPHKNVEVGTCNPRGMLETLKYRILSEFHRPKGVYCCNLILAGVCE